MKNKNESGSKKKNRNLNHHIYINKIVQDNKTLDCALQYTSSKGHGP